MKGEQWLGYSVLRHRPLHHQGWFDHSRVDAAALHGNHAKPGRATIEPGVKTLLHRHRATEEIYHFTGGDGRMTRGGETFPVTAGDSVCVAPGTPHCVENTGPTALKILCACAPAYSHDDTELL
jgi:mannose-6-phosphate isomerase-like protein (cupin superfamily)